MSEIVEGSKPVEKIDVHATIRTLAKNGLLRAFEGKEGNSFDSWPANHFLRNMKTYEGLVQAIRAELGMGPETFEPPPQSGGSSLGMVGAFAGLGGSDHEDDVYDRRRKCGRKGDTEAEEAAAKGVENPDGTVKKIANPEGLAEKTINDLSIEFDGTYPAGKTALEKMAFCEYRRRTNVPFRSETGDIPLNEVLDLYEKRAEITEMDGTQIPEETRRDWDASIRASIENSYGYEKGSITEAIKLRAMPEQQKDL